MVNESWYIWSKILLLFEEFRSAPFSLVHWIDSRHVAKKNTMAAIKNWKISICLIKKRETCSSLPHPSNPSAPHLFTLTTTPCRGVVLHGVFLTIKRPRLHSNPNRHSVFFLRCNPNRWNREGRLWDGEGHPWDGEVWQRHWEEEGAYCIGGEEEGFWNMHQR